MTVTATPQLLRPFFLAAVLAAAAFCSPPAAAQELRITEPWARATVSGQTATGVYMRIEASEAARLVAVASPLAKTAEIHEMAMVGQVMKMRPVAALELPAGKVVELRPKSYHIMLTGLAKPLKAGETVPLTLQVEGAGKKRHSIDVQATVRSLTAPAAHDHSGHSGMH